MLKAKSCSRRTATRKTSCQLNTYSLLDLNIAEALHRFNNYDVLELRT